MKTRYRINLVITITVIIQWNKGASCITTVKQGLTSINVLNEANLHCLLKSLTFKTVQRTMYLWTEYFKQAISAGFDKVGASKRRIKFFVGTAKYCPLNLFGK